MPGLMLDAVVVNILVTAKVRNHNGLHINTNWAKLKV